MQLTFLDWAVVALYFLFNIGIGFYYKARAATADELRALARPGQTVVVIGDAIRAGKSKPAISSAFEAALLGAVIGQDKTDAPHK